MSYALNRLYPVELRGRRKNNTYCHMLNEAVLSIQAREPDRRDIIVVCNGSSRTVQSRGLTREARREG